VVFILADDAVYTPTFLMNWTDLVMKCAQRGHQVLVSQRRTRAECFTSSGTDVFDGYMCIDADVVFSPDDVLRLLESPHDVTCALRMASDGQAYTCGKTLAEIQATDGQYRGEAVDPGFPLVRQVPAGWNYKDPIKGHVDTRVRVWSPTDPRGVIDLKHVIAIDIFNDIIDERYRLE
jgi:hypothetical protein